MTKMSWTDRVLQRKRYLSGVSQDELFVGARVYNPHTQKIGIVTGLEGGHVLIRIMTDAYASTLKILTVRSQLLWGEEDDFDVDTWKIFVKLRGEPLLEQSSLSMGDRFVCRDRIGVVHDENGQFFAMTSDPMNYVHAEALWGEL